jgi:hypothetical protein
MQPLALPSSHTPLVYQNPLSNLVNALPYLDDELFHQDEALKAKVSQAIYDEMSRMPRIDYLASMPMPATTYTTRPNPITSFRTDRYNVDHIKPKSEKDATSYMEAIDDLNKLQHYNSTRYDISRLSL